MYFSQSSQSQDNEPFVEFVKRYIGAFGCISNFVDEI